MKVQSQQFIVDAKGGKKAIVPPIKRYERMQEDLHDLAVVAERREESPVAIAVMKSRLKRKHER